MYNPTNPMTIAVKICGINSKTALAAAVTAGAAFVGFVFYPRSPRNITSKMCALLGALTPAGILKVGLFVEPEDALLDTVLAVAHLDLLQLHGAETPERVLAIKARFGLPVMKAISVAGRDDVAGATRYVASADRLLFDAKPPKRPDAMPGGNAESFDWRLLAGQSWPCPWMLSGGLTPENVADSVRVSGAMAVDVSSGVESSPGVKDPVRIQAFISALRGM